eukprot:s167_g2.t1
MQGSANAFFVFSREFFHPCDNMKGATPAAIDRFRADSRRFPAQAYEEGSLVWRQNEWRVPSTGELSMMLGIPLSATAAVPDPEPRRTQVRNSLLGSGFHLPCIMCLMCMLLSLCEAKPTLSRFCPKDVLAAKVQHPLWEPGFLERFSDLFGPAELVDSMRFQFQELQVRDQVWDAVHRNLELCNLSLPQAFFAFQRGRGKPWQVLAPLPLRARDRAQIFAGNTGQRYSSDSSKGLDHLLPPGLGKAGHMSQALELQSPFTAKPWPEDDITFLAETIRVWGVDLPLLAQKQRDTLKAIARAVQPLQSILAQQRCTSARKVASSKNAAFIALVSALLRWPDLGQAQAFILGFPIVGPVPTSTLAESLDDKEDSECWLQREGRSVVDDLMCKGPPRDSDIILQVTEDEIKKGFCSPLLSRSVVANGDYLKDS